MQPPPSINNISRELQHQIQTAPYRNWLQKLSRTTQLDALNGIGAETY